jgi:hypothetical protein
LSATPIKDSCSHAESPIRAKSQNDSWRVPLWAGLLYKPIRCGLPPLVPNPEASRRRCDLRSRRTCEHEKDDADSATNCSHEIGPTLSERSTILASRSGGCLDPFLRMSSRIARRPSSSAERKAEPPKLRRLPDSHRDRFFRIVNAHESPRSRAMSARS